LSPPWGGMDYKFSEDFSLKEWITPSIDSIIENGLSLSQNLIFYLPRNTKPEELYKIICENEDLNNVDEDDLTSFVEIQKLTSANKVKALLVLYGQDFNYVRQNYYIIFFIIIKKFLDYC
jgi:hypothetical protein